MLIEILFVIFLITSCWSSDQRCLLDGGGSTDTFFVREDSPVGAEVGRIRVNGRYSEVTLSLVDMVRIWIK